LEGVTSFGEDVAGNLYFVELGGELYRIVGPIIGVAAGDFNKNGVVDAADYSVWRRSLGEQVPYYTVADASGDGIVNDADYDVWRANFGTILESGIAGAAATTIVPESSCLSSLLVASVLLALSQLIRKRLAKLTGPPSACGLAPTGT
jgi:hypothetical protein